MYLIDLEKACDPYNYCDRWCQRCLATNNCPLFKEETRERQRYLSKGKDPDSLGFGFELISQSLTKSLKLLSKASKKWDIDPVDLEWDEEDYQKYLEEEKEEENRIHSHPLFQLSREWEDHSLKFLTHFDLAEIRGNPDLETVEWFATLIPAKVYRGLATVFDAHPLPLEHFDDAVNSFGICLRGINSCLFSLKTINEIDTIYVEEISYLMEIAGKLKFSLEYSINERLKLISEHDE